MTGPRRTVYIGIIKSNDSCQTLERTEIATDSGRRDMTNYLDTIQQLHERLVRLTLEINEMKQKAIRSGLEKNLEEISNIKNNFFKLAEFIENNFNDGSGYRPDHVDSGDPSRVLH